MNLKLSNLDFNNKIGPANKFYIWIVLSGAITITSLAKWGDIQKDRVITINEKTIKELKQQDSLKDIRLTQQSLQIDSLRKELYEANSNSIDKFVDYSKKIKQIKTTLSQENYNIQKENSKLRKSINAKR